jgi:phosphoenolpyruvate carboxykinase (GTP)
VTTTGIIGLDQPPTIHHGLLAWVTDVAALTNPDAVVWCDGSDAERERLTHKLIEAGTFIQQETSPRTFRCAMDPEDVAEVGRHTYVCAREESTVDPAVNWMEPVDMKIILTEEYRGCMRGRVLYVVPFLHPDTADGPPMLGVQITDSEYVVVSMHLMSGAGTMGFAAFGDGVEFMRYVHSVGAPRRPGQPNVPWPCDHTKYVAQFPETRTIWSYGSGFVSNPLLGKDFDLTGVPLNRPADAADAMEARRIETAAMEAWFAEAILLREHIEGRGLPRALPQTLFPHRGAKGPDAGRREDRRQRSSINGSNANGGVGDVDVYTG